MQWFLKTKQKCKKIISISYQILVCNGSSKTKQNVKKNWSDVDDISRYIVKAPFSDDLVNIV